MKDSTPDLTICIIGRNEEKKLSQLAKSLELLEKSQLTYESIYVDSASTDGSVTLASRLFDSTIVLKDSYYLSAAAGRYIGTTHARAEWILYLDGDMTLCSEFLPIIESTVKNNTTCGIIGTYIHQYYDGTIREAKYANSNAPKIAYHFGGASLIKKNIVDNAGGWNYRLFSNEEDDLYVRIQRNENKISFTDTPMIMHNTENFTSIEKLINLFIPHKKGLGKKYFGFGQLCVSAVRNGYLGALLQFWPQPFIYFAGIIASISSLLIGNLLFFLLTSLLLISYMAFSKGLKFLIIYLAFIPQLLLGCWKYNGLFKPVIEKIIKYNGTPISG